MNATGSENTAAIGSINDIAGTINIKGGTINATGSGDYAPGIGGHGSTLGGFYGTVTITGGYVFAKGLHYADRHLREE